ncbi:DEAD/DEAH box helicase family protein [Tenacibaculum sp.]|uniref:DEAD/DEAH box helicase family protein n=1 Tax=Tenacibaculum sp. TaxID=1906242 RepID=UPI003AA86698
MCDNVLTPEIEEKIIGYKKISINDYELGYNVKSKVIKPDRNGFVSDGVSDFFINNSDNLNKSETVLFNFGVGQGKSTTFNRLINKYIEKGYVAIILVPFKSLIEKYYDEFSNLEDNRFNYRDFEIFTPRELKVNEVVKKDLHVLTVNAFLRNPGDSYVLQSRFKQQYLDLLYKRCIDDNKKVVLFIDEIHASIHNFQRDKIFNLFNWEDRLHKAFLASATFTESTTQLSKYFSLLTDRNIQILEADRTKIEEKRSDITLMLSNESYNSVNIEKFLNLEKIILESLHRERAINILSYSKNLAKAIRKTYQPIFKRFFRDLKLCTSETDYEFDEHHDSHVGTNFSTGVNINSGVFIVLLPPYSMIEGLGMYGVFTDGYIALIQSIARMRKKGDIYIFSSIPSVLLEGDYIENIKDLEIIEEAKVSPFNRFEDRVNKFKSLYVSLKEKHQNKIDFIESFKEYDKRIGFGGISQNHIGIKLNYPTYEEFLLKYSDKFFYTSEYSAGKKIIPYLFWALFNDQFQNAKLKEILLDKKTLDLNKDNISSRLSELFEEILSTPFGMNMTSFSLKSGYENLKFLRRLLLGYSISYNNKRIGVDNLFIQAALMKYIGRLLKNINEYNDVNYFNDCIEVSVKYDNNDNELINVYKVFYDLKQSFIDFIESNKIEIKGGYYMPASLNDEVFLSPRIYSLAITVFSKINEQDTFVKNKSFSLLRGQETPDENTVYKKLCDLFVEFDKQKVKRKNSKRYYFIDGFVDVKDNYINFLYNEDLNPFYDMNDVVEEELFPPENNNLLEVLLQEESIVEEYVLDEEKTNSEKEKSNNTSINSPFGEIITPNDLDFES